MENVDLIVEKEKKSQEIDALSKKNEFVQDYFKNLVSTSQNYLEKMEKYKLEIDEFFQKFNETISSFPSKI